MSTELSPLAQQVVDNFTREQIGRELTRRELIEAGVVQSGPVCVSGAPDAHQVRIVVGPQCFHVGNYHESKAEADHYAGMLSNALASAFQKVRTP